MLLSQTAEYALRAMAWVSISTPDEPVRTKELSAATGIPIHYLSKVLRRLVLAGVLTSQKGQGGGFRLARLPDEIRFIDILAAVDAEPKQDQCAFGWGDCDAEHPCPLHEPWSRLGDAVFAWASTTTLSAVRKPRRPDRRLGQ